MLSQDEVQIRSIERYISNYRLSKKLNLRNRCVGEVHDNFEQLEYDMRKQKSASIMIIDGCKIQAVPRWNFGFYRFKNKGNRISRKHQGSGVLIKTPYAGRQFAITTGHQWDNTKESDVSFMAFSGSLSKEDIELDEFVYPLKLVKKFNTSSNKEALDLAIVEITDFPYSGVGLDVLPSGEFKQLFSGDVEHVGVALGWGMTNKESGVVSQVLRYAAMEFHALAGNPNMFNCVSFDERGPATMDSGGPMVVVSESRVLLTGIVKGVESLDERFYHTNKNPCRFICVPFVMDSILSAIKEYVDNPQCE